MKDSKNLHASIEGTGIIRKFGIIASLAVILPFMIFVYILYKNGTLFSPMGYSNIFMFMMAVVISAAALLIMYKLFASVSKMTAAITNAGKGEAAPMEAVGNTAEFREISASFNQLLDRYQEASRNLERRAFDLLNIKDLVDVASKTVDMETVLDALLDKATAVTMAERGSVFLCEPEKGQFRILAVKSLGKGVKKGGRIPYLDSPARFVLAEKQPLLVQNIESDLRFSQANAEGYTSGSFLIMPILSGRQKELVGVLNLSQKRGENPFDQDDVHVLAIMVNEIGFALENSRLFASIKEHAALLEKQASQLQQEIGERQRAEEGMAVAKQKAEMANKAKTEFLGYMTHEIRTPLTAIMGLSETIADGGAGSITERQETYLNHILLNSQHLLSVINDALDLGKVEAGKMEFRPEECDLQEIIKSTLAMVREQAKECQVEIDTEADKGLDHIMADKRKIKQILSNLLSNAVKFSSPGSRVSLRAWSMESGEDMETSSKGAVAFSVQDSGTGISEEGLKKLFQPFQQVASGQEGHEGTGLGLALCKRLVELHNGRIWAESEPGKGSTFSFTIPRQPPQGAN